MRQNRAPGCPGCVSHHKLAKVIQDHQRKKGDPLAGLALDLDVHPHLAVQRLFEAPYPVGGALVADDLQGLFQGLAFRHAGGDQGNHRLQDVRVVVQRKAKAGPARLGLQLPHAVFGQKARLGLVTPGVGRFSLWRVGSLARPGPHGVPCFAIARHIKVHLTVDQFLSDPGDRFLGRRL